MTSVSVHISADVGLLMLSWICEKLLGLEDEVNVNVSVEVEVADNEVEFAGKTKIMAYGCKTKHLLIIVPPDVNHANIGL